MIYTDLRKYFLVWSIAAAVVLLFGGVIVMAKAGSKTEFSLPALQKDILSRYKGVSHMEAQELASKLKTDEDSVILFDVREAGEFNVSHIAGAIQIAPNIWHSPFMKKYGERLKGKTVVFYCSVGVRSSKLAAYVGEAAKQIGASAVVNLTHGIFGWHNESLPLKDNSNNTSFVHPYNKHWGQLVNRSELIRYKPPLP